MLCGSTEADICRAHIFRACHAAQTAILSHSFPEYLMLCLKRLGVCLDEVPAFPGDQLPYETPLRWPEIRVDPDAVRPRSNAITLVCMSMAPLERSRTGKIDDHAAMAASYELGKEQRGPNIDGHRPVERLMPDAPTPLLQTQKADLVVGFLCLDRRCRQRQPDHAARFPSISECRSRRRP